MYSGRHLCIARPTAWAPTASAATATAATATAATASAATASAATATCPPAVWRRGIRHAFSRPFHCYEILYHPPQRWPGAGGVRHPSGTVRVLGPPNKILIAKYFLRLYRPTGGLFPPFLLTAMETLAHFPGAAGAYAPARSEASAPATAGTHWSWWLFLLGVLACSCAGPACALN